MSAHRFQSAWRSLIFNRVFDDSGITDDESHLVTAYKESDYRLDSLDITRVQVSDYREIRQWLEGTEPNEAFEGYRMLQGRGIILGSSVGDLEDKTWAMYEAFSPAACRLAFAANDPVGLGPFTFKRATATTPLSLQFFARPGSGRPVIIGRQREGLSRRFVFSLVALDPFAYSQTLTQTTPSLAGGTVTNNGNIYARPKIRITTTAAGASNFTITNSTTGQSIVLDMSWAGSGSVVILDATRGTAASGTGVNRYDKIVSGFVTSMFLAAGANTIAFANTTNITSVRFDFRDAYA